MISVAEACARILRDAAPGPVEATSLLRARGKVLAEPIVAPLCLPPFDHAAMDGFAVRASDLGEAAPTHPLRLPIVSEQAAGRARVPALRAGTACRIMTGAPLPRGADAVVRQEDCREEGGGVVFERPTASGAHVRICGEDLRTGDLLLEAGALLTPSRIALLAGLGLVEVRVHAAPRVAILTTGDELAIPGQALAPGQIYDSNSFALAAMVAEAGAIPLMLGAIRDDREQTFQQLLAATAYDVILTTGGVSVGRYDLVGETLGRHGALHFDRVAQKPGKPFTYATLWGKPVFALPGNPGAAMVCFEVYVRPFLRRLAGFQIIERPRLWVKMAEPYSQKPGRRAFLRVILERSPDGPMARLAGSQGSASLRSMAQANALVIVPEDVHDLAPGERAEALALDGFPGGMVEG